MSPTLDQPKRAPSLHPDEPRFRFSSASVFSRAIARRVHEEFAASGDHRFADLGQWLQGLALLVTGLSAYALILRGSLSGGAVAALAVVASLCDYMLMVILGHGATHGSLSRRSWINDLVVFLSFAVLGASGALWRDRHVRLHHNYPNLSGTGIDADSTALLRLSPHKARHALHALQPVYAPLLYAVGLLHLAWFEDFVRFAGMRRAGVAGFRKGRALAELVAAKAIHVTLFLVVPAAVLAPSLVVLLEVYLLAMGVCSLAFAIMALGSHVSDLAEFPLPNADGRLPHDWATHQLATSVDWSPLNPLVIGLTGGANAEAAHHLFPDFNHRHAAALSKIIYAEAAAHGVPCHAVSFPQMLLAHWRQITRLSVAAPSVAA
jgi:linoleoyl-CoA desaturase